MTEDTGTPVSVPSQRMRSHLGNGSVQPGDWHSNPRTILDRITRTPWVVPIAGLAFLAVTELLGNWAFLMIPFAAALFFERRTVDRLPPPLERDAAQGPVSGLLGKLEYVLCLVAGVPIAFVLVWHVAEPKAGPEGLIWGFVGLIAGGFIGGLLWLVVRSLRERLVSQLGFGTALALFAVLVTIFEWQRDEPAPAPAPAAAAEPPPNRPARATPPSLFPLIEQARSDATAIERIEQALAAGADVNAHERTGRTPLATVFASEDIGCEDGVDETRRRLAQLLLDKGANPSKDSMPKGRSLAHEAVGDPELFASLIAHGSDPNLGANIWSTLATCSVEQVLAIVAKVPNLGVRRGNFGPYLLAPSPSKDPGSASA